MYDRENTFSQDRVKWFGTGDTPELLVLDRDAELPEKMCVVCNIAFKYYDECPECQSVSCDACSIWRRKTQRRKDFKMRMLNVHCPVCDTFIHTLY